MRPRWVVVGVTAIAILVTTTVVLLHRPSPPPVPCESFPSCQRLAQHVFHEKVLLPTRARLSAGYFYNNQNGLEVWLRLNGNGLYFSETVNKSSLAGCGKRKHAPSGRNFCYGDFENGCIASFKSGGLTYLLLVLQVISEPVVPLLPQAMVAVDSLGPP